MTNLVLQSFGRESEYRRAVLTILSYYSYTTLSLDRTRVILFTDNPDFFNQYVAGLPVHFVFLTPEKIRLMRGEIDFLHRMKIVEIEEAFNIADGNLLYADSDTFFMADPTPLMNQLSKGKAFMHLLEYPFVENTEDKTETYRSFYSLINNKDFLLSNGRKIKVSSQHCSWNAGVMFFHATHSRFIPDVYALTDQFYPASGSHASEQYAFSIVLQEHVELAPCEQVIYHYWYRVKKQIIDQFLAHELDERWAKKSMSEKLQIIKSWTINLPDYFEKHEWMVKDNAIQAFNRNDFSTGYKWALKAVMQKPLTSKSFIKDTLYHIKRHISAK